MNEETLRQLIDMKFHGMVAGFSEFLQNPTSNELGFEDLFGMLVDREWTDRQERRLKYRLGKAKLREQACVEDIDYRHPRGLDKSVMQRLTKCQWIKNRENIIFTGKTGLGKTWLACALSHKACLEGYSALYARIPRLLQEL